MAQIDPVLMVECIRAHRPQTNNVDIAHLVAIALAENNGASTNQFLRTDVIFRNENGTDDVGILQINDIWGLTVEQRLDWQLSVKFALDRIVRWDRSYDQNNPQNNDRFGPWVAYWLRKWHKIHLPLAWNAIQRADLRAKVQAQNGIILSTNAELNEVKSDRDLLAAEVVRLQAGQATLRDGISAAHSILGGLFA